MACGQVNRKLRPALRQSAPWSTAMLAEIYLLKLEAAVRAAKELATTASASRFVPVTIPVAKAFNPAFHRAIAICRSQPRRTPRIQNNSGLPQGPPDPGPVSPGRC